MWILVQFVSGEFAFLTFPYLPAQPAGVPEILKKSLHSCSVRGGEEVFIIGKNFLKGTKVIFQENIAGVFLSLFLSLNFSLTVE